MYEVPAVLLAIPNVSGDWSERERQGHNTPDNHGANAGKDG
jgi:hypothetical protein